MNANGTLFENSHSFDKIYERKKKSQYIDSRMHIATMNVMWSVLKRAHCKKVRFLVASRLVKYNQAVNQ